MSAESATQKTHMRMGKMIRESFHAMTPVERRRVIGMYGSILLLHAIGFFIFIVFVVPAHYKGLAFGVAAGLHPRPAARLRRRPHLGDRQHHPQGDEPAQ